MGSTACRAVVGNPAFIGKLKFPGLTPVCGTAGSRHVAAHALRLILRLHSLLHGRSGQRHAVTACGEDAAATPRAAFRSASQVAAHALRLILRLYSLSHGRSAYEKVNGKPNIEIFECAK